MKESEINDKSYQEMTDAFKKANESFQFDTDSFDNTLDKLNANFLKSNGKEIERITNASKQKKSGLKGALHGLLKKK